MGNEASRGGSSSVPTVSEIPGFDRVDDAYQAKMSAYEMDCNAGKGEPIACHHTGEFISVVRDEPDKANKVFELNCREKEYAPSCFSLARAYLVGRGVPQDDIRAEEYYDQACDRGHIYACHHKAEMLYSLAVHPVPESNIKRPSDQLMAQALAILEATCAKGYTDSCHVLGHHLLSQDNPDRDPVRAKQFLTKSCEEGDHSPSCFNLAVMHRKGDVGIPQSDELFELYKKKTESCVERYGGTAGPKISLN